MSETTRSLTIKEAAARLDLTPEQLRAWLASADPPPFGYRLTHGKRDSYLIHEGPLEVYIKGTAQRTCPMDYDKLAQKIARHLHAGLVDAWLYKKP